MKAVKCPVCDGSGKVKDPDYDSDTTAGKQGNVTCHGCNGKGWVEVNEDYQFVPVNPYPYPKPWDNYPYGWITWS